MHTPPWQASPPVQAFPSSHGVVSATVMPVHTPLWQVSSVVHWLPSSHGVLSGSGVPAQTPPWQVSLLVQEFSSSHAAPSSSAALPTQVPFWQVSAAVQKLPSSHFVPVNGVTVQLEVPLQIRVLHWSEVQVIAVPTHSPLLEQVSLKVQALPSSHVAPVFGVTVQLDVPLQVRVLHVSEVHVTAVWWQTPASQLSMVQAFPSSQSAAVEQGVQPAMGVPSHCPLPSQTSLKVQALPSSHGVLAGCKASGGQ